MTRSRIFYFVGTVLYIAAAYIGLYLMGAPMDALRELVLTIVAMFTLAAGFFFAFFLLVDRWVK